jgi:sugar lactone lactonase YvrE
VSRPAISPVPWHPQPAPKRARAKRGDTPLPQQQVIQIGGEGPEDILIGPDGAAYTGTAEGAIRRIRLDPGGGPPRVDVVAQTGGRPLGLEWLPDGRLLVCDTHLGLLAVDLTRDPAPVETLVNEVGGTPLVFLNNSAVGADGTVWFSDSSSRFGVENWRADVFEHSGTGRLVCRTPSGKVDTVLTGLQFANGVAISPDGSALFFAETSAYSLTRVMLTGPRQGQHEVVKDNLPGFPDNISLGADGLIWVALASPRDRLVDLLAPAPPWLRKAAWVTPEALQPKPKMFSWAQAYHPDTLELVYDLQGQQAGFGMSTGVREQDGRVWLSSLVGTTVATFSL